MTNLMQGLFNICNKFSPVIYLLVACSLIIIGVMFIIPSQKSKDIAKGALPWVAVGCGLVIGALTIATEISSSFVF